MGVKFDRLFFVQKIVHFQLDGPFDSRSQSTRCFLPMVFLWYNHVPEWQKVTKRQFQQELMLGEYFDHHLFSILEVFQNHSLLELEIFPIGPYQYL